MTASISYINFSWTVVSIINRDVRNCLQSMKRLGEPIATTIERYVIWSFGILPLLIKKKMNQCNDEKVIELGRKIQK